MRPTDEQIKQQNERWAERERQQIQIQREQAERRIDNNSLGECRWVLRCRENLKALDPSLSGLELAILASAAAIGFNVANISTES